MKKSRTLDGFGVLVPLFLIFLSGCNETAARLTQPGSGNGPGQGGSPAPTGTGTLTGSAVLDSEEQAFLTLINDYRAQNGAAPLQLSDALTISSDWMSNDMAEKNYFDHTDSLGRDPFTRMTDLGYAGSSYEGENIAAGNATGQDTFTQWKNSPGHNANMLNSAYRVIGIGRAYSASSAYGWYWTTDFGS